MDTEIRLFTQRRPTQAMKRKADLYLPDDLLAEAKRLGLNVSRIAEQALRIAVIKAREAKRIMEERIQPIYRARR